jgi:hypothetical protein
LGGAGSDHDPAWVELELQALGGPRVPEMGLTEGVGVPAGTRGELATSLDRDERALRVPSRHVVHAGLGYLWSVDERGEIPVHPGLDGPRKQPLRCADISAGRRHDSCGSTAMTFLCMGHP